MLFTAKGRYALSMMLDIAAQGGDACVPLRDISARQNVSVKYLEQVASQLVKAGLIKSVRGAQGGYRMAKPPHACTAGEALRAVERRLGPDTEGLSPCDNNAACAAALFWDGLESTVNAYVDSSTLESLLDAQLARGYDYNI